MCFDSPPAFTVFAGATFAVCAVVAMIFGAPAPGTGLEVEAAETVEDAALGGSACWAPASFALSNSRFVVVSLGDGLDVGV